MKTKNQIVKYTSQCHFSEEDWQKVLGYCRERFGGGKAHKALRPISESTYEEFIDWVDNGYGVGDIVRYGHTIGIFGACTPGRSYLSAYLSLDGEIIENELEVSNNKVYKPEPEDEAKIKSILRSNELIFSVSLGCLTKAYKPKNGDFVRISNDTTQTSGIFRISDGEYFYFYVYISSEDIVFKDYKVPVSSVTLSLPTKKDTERIQVALAKNKLEWAARIKVLRSVDNARAKKGGKYWYFSERFSICGDIDMYTKKHNERHDNGNYFCSYDSALLFMQKARELRKKIAGVV